MRDPDVTTWFLAETPNPPLTYVWLDEDSDFGPTAYMEVCERMRTYERMLRRHQKGWLLQVVVTEHGLLKYMGDRGYARAIRHEG